MKDREIVVEIEALHKRDEHDKIIELLENRMASSELDDELKGLLARAIQNSKEPDWVKAYDILKSCKEEEKEKPNWNFRLGYNCYYRDKIVEAIEHFEKELEVNPEDPYREDVLEFLDDCRRRVSLGIQSYPFNERAKDFWADIIRLEEELERLFNSNNQDDILEAIELIQYALRQNGLFSSIEIGAGEKFEKPHIVFSPEGLLPDYIMLKQLVKLIPEQLKEKYKVTIGREMGTGFAFKMNDITLDGDNVEMAFERNENSLIVYIKNKELFELYNKDENEALKMAYIFTDSFLGELFCIRHVDDLLIEENSKLEYKNIKEVVAEIMAMFSDETYESYPFDTYQVYHLKEKEKVETIRDRVISGVTCIAPVVREYLNEETTTFDENFDKGIVYASLIADTGELEQKEALEIRYELEDILKELEDDIYRIIGGATGYGSIFIDLIIFDMERFEKEILDKYYIENAIRLGLKAGYINMFNYKEDVYTLFNKEDAVDNSKMKEEFNGENKSFNPPVMYEEDDWTLLEEYIDDNFGRPDSVFHEIVSEDIHVDVHIIKPNEKKDYYTLITTGMGAVPMDVPDEYSDTNPKRAELVICLPSSWKIESDDERDYWPIRWLKIIAHLPIDNNTWVGKYHTIGNEGSFADEDTFSALILTDCCDIEKKNTIQKKVKLSNNEEVAFYQLVPIYQSELDYKNEDGGKKLLDKIENNTSFKDTYVVNVNRENAFEVELPSMVESKKEDIIKLEDENKIIEFKDEVFEQAIRDLFNLEGEIKWKDIGYREELIFVGFIRISNTDIYNIKLTEEINSLEDLKWFVNVVELRINYGEPDEPLIFGELKDILGLKRLKYLDLSGAVITGDLSLLNEYSHLKELTLTGLDITGELKDLKDFVHLKELYICDTEVDGDLKDIDHLINLKNLNLSFSKITGDLTSIGHLTDLEELDMHESEIEGELSSLKKLTGLRYLSLGYTYVEGDLKDISNLDKLLELGLADLEITGELSDLFKIKELKELNLEDTDITGTKEDILHFEKLLDVTVDLDEVD